MAAQRVVRTRIRLIILIGATLIAGALLMRAWLEQPPALPPPLAGAGADSSTTGMRAVPLWFASADGESLVVEPREMQERSGLHVRL